MIFAKKTGLETLQHKLQSERADKAKSAIEEPLYTPREEDCGAPLFGTRKPESVIFPVKSSNG